MKPVKIPEGAVLVMVASGFENTLRYGHTNEPVEIVRTPHGPIAYAPIYACREDAEKFHDPNKCLFLLIEAAKR